MIIGLTGKNCSGKGEVAEFLKSRNFDYLSLSDELRKEVQKRGEQITRENLIRTGRALRAELGAGVLAERIFRHLEPDKNYVVDSFRNPAEAEVFKSRRDFALIKISASPNIRFERIHKRGRESDPTDFEAFMKLEESEAVATDASGQALVETGKIADHEIKNEGTLEELRSRITALVQELSCTTPRPDWDEYFMGIARVVALRSNCIKRKVAAILVKDRRIVSTGYNGTPSGVKNCNEGGCPRCSGMTASGEGLDKCLCNHAEENAIVQAAYHGVHLTGSTLYSTFAPCLLCAKMIINSGISGVVYNEDYPLNDSAFHLFKEAGVKVRRLQVE